MVIGIEHRVFRILFKGFNAELCPQSLKLFIYFDFICMNILPVGLHMYHAHVWCIRSLITIGDCELPFGFWGPVLGTEPGSWQSNKCY